MSARIERIACPHCGKPDYEVFNVGDGGTRNLMRWVKEAS